MGLIGIDLGGTQLRVAVADDRGRLKTVVRRATRPLAGVSTSSTASWRRSRMRWTRTAPRHDGCGRSHRAPGAGRPGGRLSSARQSARFQKRAPQSNSDSGNGHPSFLHHDAHLAALGEHQRGAARAPGGDLRDVSTGIGAGLILHGELYAGAHGSRARSAISSCSATGRCAPAAFAVASRRSPAVPGSAARARAGAANAGQRAPRAHEPGRRTWRAPPAPAIRWQPRSWRMPAPTSGSRSGRSSTSSNPQLIVLGAACSGGRPTASPYAPVDERVVLEGLAPGLRIVAPRSG